MFRLLDKISVNFCLELSPVAFGVIHFVQYMILNLGLSDWKAKKEN